MSLSERVKEHREKTGCSIQEARRLFVRKAFCTISAVRFLMMQELRREDEKYDVEYMDKLIAVHNKVMGMP